MSTLINSLTVDQVDAILSAYGTITDWLGTLNATVINDLML
ncbi:hypothetical protein [Neolewinella persica]|nr:hypothetical protein [Neolewinella persica]